MVCIEFWNLHRRSIFQNCITLNILDSSTKKEEEGDDHSEIRHMLCCVGALIKSSIPNVEYHKVCLRPMSIHKKISIWLAS